jgi:hypothetical protein
MPMNACCPTETSPPKPASAFHITARITRMYSDVSFCIEFSLKVTGTNASSPSSPAKPVVNNAEIGLQR